MVLCHLFHGLRNLLTSRGGGYGSLAAFDFRDTFSSVEVLFILVVTLIEPSSLVIGPSPTLPTIDLLLLITMRNPLSQEVEPMPCLPIEQIVVIIFALLVLSKQILW